MCCQVDCPKCKQPTYAGCGAHVEQVLRNVPPNERCRCREEKAKQEVSGDQRSWLRKVFG
jgi:hypothetical protein